MKNNKHTFGNNDPTNRRFLIRGKEKYDFVVQQRILSVRAFLPVLLSLETSAALEKLDALKRDDLNGDTSFDVCLGRVQSSLILE